MYDLYGVSGSHAIVESKSCADQINLYGIMLTKPTILQFDCSVTLTMRYTDKSLLILRSG